MRFEFCPTCGDKLNDKEIGDEGMIPFCHACSKPFFDWIPQCIITAVVNEFDEIALLRQDYVTTDTWILIAGFIKKGESLEESVAREVLEESGQKVVSVEYMSSYYYEKKELLMAGFLTRVMKGPFTESKEVDRIEWFPIREAEKNLKPDSIAHQLYKAIMQKEYDL